MNLHSLKSLLVISEGQLPYWWGCADRKGGQYNH